MPKKRTAPKTNESEDRSVRSNYERLAVGLGRESYVTKAGIDTLLRNIRKEGLPTVFSRCTQYRARKNVCNTITPYGPLVESERIEFGNGRGGFDLGFQNPQAWLHYQAQHSEHFALIIEEALQTYACTPQRKWSIVIYQDGVNPSDGLSVNPSRASHVFYWSFLELGTNALSHEECWGTITLMRKLDANKSEGALCQVFHRVVNRFFKDPHNFRKSGINLELYGSGKSVWIGAELRMILCDEPGIKEIIGCKGHAGNKPCFACINAVQDRGFGAQAPWWQTSTFFVSIAETDFKKFKGYDPGELRKLVEKLHLCGADEVEEKSGAYGWNCNPWSLSLDPDVEDIDKITVFDWAHCYLIDGLLDVEFGLCMKWLHKNTCTRYAEMWEYIQTFKWPRCRASLEHLFTQENNAKHIRTGNLNCTASEMLTLAPVAKRYFKKVLLPREGPIPVIQSLLAVLIVIELLQGIKCHATDPDVLAAAIKYHLDCFIDAYGKERIRPKHHYVLHLAPMLKKFGFLLSTFVHERRHRMVRRYTMLRKILKSWSLSVIEEVTCHSIWEMSHRFYNAFDTTVPTKHTLLSLQDLFPGVPSGDFSLHKTVSIHMGAAEVGDVVSCHYNGKLHFGELLITVGIAADKEFGGDVFSFVSLWEHHPQPSDDDTGRTFRVQDNPKLIQTCDLDACFIHRPAGDGNTSFVLIPRERHMEARPC